MKLSVVIPIHGRIELLSACLQSFSVSSVTPDEIIVVDDGNSEADAKKICLIANNFSATIIRSEIRSGAADARNRGALCATGDLIFFADADITIEENGLELLIRALEQNQHAAFSYGDFMLGKILMRGKKFSFAELTKTNYISTMSLIKTSWFNGFDVTLLRFQDWDLWLSIAEKGGTGAYTPHTIFKTNSGGTMSSRIPRYLVLHQNWFQWIPRVHAYTRARKILFKKHGLS